MLGIAWEFAPLEALSEEVIAGAIAVEITGFDTEAAVGVGELTGPVEATGVEALAATEEGGLMARLLCLINSAIEGRLVAAVGGDAGGLDLSGLEGVSAVLGFTAGS